MNLTCPALSPQSQLEIDSLLASVDCYSRAAVEGVYGRLFGTDGMLGSVLTGLLTLYLAFYAVKLISGRTSLGLSALMPRVFMLGGVLTIATSWPAYHQLIYSLLTAGPDELASGLLGESHAALRFAALTQQLYEQILSATDALVSVKVSGGNGEATLATASDLLWASGLMMLIGTAGTLIVAKLMLALLLALGPAFALFAIFSATRGLAEGWLRTAVLFALIPLIVTLLGRVALVALSPFAASLTWGVTAQTNPASTVMILFAGTLIYLCLLAIAVRTAFVLTQSWQLSSFGAEQTAAPSSVAGPASPPLQPHSPLAGPATSPSSVNARSEGTGHIVAALMRMQGSDTQPALSTGSRGPIIMSPQPAPSPPQATGSRSSRAPITRRQSRKAIRPHRPLSGIIGQ